MNISRFRAAGVVALFPLAILLILATQHAGAVEALLLQDTYVESGLIGGTSSDEANYGDGTDLRVFKGNNRTGRAFIQFSLDTLPPETKAEDIIQARMRLWVNSNTTAVGAITLTPVTDTWDEYKLTGNSATKLTFGSPQLVNLPIESLNSFISINVTNWVKAWRDNTLQNEGIVIEPGTDTDFLDIWFDSKESNQTHHEARLEITLRKE